MNITILRCTRDEEKDLNEPDIETTEQVANIERDDAGLVTMYCDETEKGLWYMVLSQDLINEIAKFKTE